MSIGLVIAGSLCLVLALGHTLVGRGVLDSLPRTLQPTRFGDGALTRGAVLFTWHGLGLMLTTTGAILIALASSAPADDRSGVLLLVGAVYAAATVLLVWRSRRRPSDLLRAPVWVLMIVISILCLLST